MKKAREAQVAEFERVPGSVFVRVSNPNAVAPVPSVERHYSDWSEIAAEIAADGFPAETPEPETPVIDEVRVYAVDTLTGERRHLYTGERADDIQDRCRAYANRSKLRVELHDTEQCEVFHPINPPCEPPISDEPKPPAIRIFNADTDELIQEGEKFPSDFESRAKEYVEKHNVTLRVETHNGRKMRFYIPQSEKMRMALENAEAAKAKRRNQ